MKRWLLSISLYAVILIFTAAYWWINNPTSEVFGKIPSAHAFFYNFGSLQIAQEKMALHVLNDYSAGHAFFILTSGLLAHSIYVILSASNFIYVGLAVTAFFKHYTVKQSSENGVIYWALALNLSMLLAFLLSHQFMIERYAVLAALLVLLIISQPISLWVVRVWPHSRAWVKSTFTILAVAMLLDIVISQNPHPTNLKLAGTWLQENTSLNTPIALNDNRLLHYSGRLRRGITCVIDRDLSVSLKSIDNLRPYPYVVIQARRESFAEEVAPLIRDNGFHKIEEFSRGRSVVTIFKNTQPSVDPAVDCNPFR